MSGSDAKTLPATGPEPCIRDNSSPVNRQRFTDLQDLRIPEALTKCESVPVIICPVTG
ncbi:MAG: hypothetical protein GDA43_22105 [Hormoscilla sp. SP5CHS1]|nr:hypothetical protein [Hormoscilla sp. SP12CHS1]MBC6455550.1 hypothetical protein [Hormoscilla sp. SP5CHS1]